MDLSRRGVLGGLGAVCAVGAVGFAGAATVTDGEALGGVADGGPGSTDGGAGEGGEDTGGDESGAAAVDPDAPFAATLIDDGDETEPRLFDASDLAEAEGVIEEDGEHLVYVALGDEGIGAFQDRLEEAGATDDPASFVVSMSLDGTEIRRVELDRETVDALTDSEWGGVLTLPFDEERIARSVYDELADD